MSDLISRQAALDAVNGLIDRFEGILADIRETNGDESVCGLCEYDGAYIGESGDWCNECPGFDRDDCFKLRDGIRKKWITEITACMPSAQPEPSQVARDIATIIENEKDMRVIASAQPERPRGEWIDTETSYADGVRQTCRCSVCRQISPRPLGDFCRWCGADMRGEQDDSKRSGELAD